MENDEFFLMNLKEKISVYQRQKQLTAKLKYCKTVCSS